VLFRRSSMSELNEYLQRDYQSGHMSDIYKVEYVRLGEQAVKARIIIIPTNQELPWSGVFAKKKDAKCAAADLALDALRAQEQESKEARVRN
jgi:hypothetical protein